MTHVDSVRKEVSVIVSRNGGGNRNLGGGPKLQVQ